MKHSTQGHAWRAGGLLAVVATACVIYQPPLREPLPAAEGSTDLPVQVYLRNGDLIRYDGGISLHGDTISGFGARMDPALRSLGTVTTFPLDSVVGIETLQRRLDLTASVATTVVAVGGGAFAIAGLSVAVFGSCPTVYVPSEAASPADAPPVSELFSHSVSPLLEARDVDVLPAGAYDRESGQVRLDLRNEALETHFLNHLELLEVRHAPDEVVLPDPVGLPVAISGWLAVENVRDGEGRGLAQSLSEADGHAYSATEGRLAAAREGDLTEQLLFEVARPIGADSVAIALRSRNSLLSTVLLYDFLLAGADLRGVEWLGRTVQQIGTAARMGAWFHDRMGLHLELWSQGGWVSAARLPDTGPIAWKEAALVVPVPPDLADGEPLRFRLRFLVDHWRIDRVRVAANVRRPDFAVHAVESVVRADGTDAPDMRAAVASPDTEYLETRPGAALWIDFAPEAYDRPRTFLLAGQGYYTEWLRPAWVDTDHDALPRFTPDDAHLPQVLERWQAKRADMEEAFLASRLATEREIER